LLFTESVLWWLLVDYWSLGESTSWRSWLRQCATSQKVAGLIPNGIIGIFHWHNPSGRTMALGSTQPLTEMSTRNTSWWVKAYGWQPYHLHVLIVWKSGSFKLLEPSGLIQACNGVASSFIGHYVHKRDETLWSTSFSAPVVAMIQNHNLIGNTLMLEFGNVCSLEKYVSSINCFKTPFKVWQLYLVQGSVTGIILLTAFMCYVM
jgi:hypothetical protein